MEKNDGSKADESTDFVTLKREVDSLQIALNSHSAPWYKSFPVVVSVISAIFSVGSAFVSYVKAESQELHNSRVELRGLLQRLASLPKENVEIIKKYEGDPAAISSISGFLNQENAILARQAAEIAEEMPEKYISATEYYSVAVALQNAYDMQGARKLATKAIGKSKDFNDRIAALRMRANLLFSMGQTDLGCVDYQQALGVFSEFENIYSEFTKKTTHIITEISWAYSEANVGNMDEAFYHIRNAEGHTVGLMESPGLNHFKGVIAAARTTIQGPKPPGDLLLKSPLTPPGPIVNSADGVLPK